MDRDANLVKWKWEKRGDFTIKSAYRVLSGNAQAYGRDWGRVWKVEAPLRYKTLLWLATRQYLLTNANRTRRGLTMDVGCSLCRATLEDTLHVLHDCTHSKAI